MKLSCIECIERDNKPLKYLSFAIGFLGLVIAFMALILMIIFTNNQETLRYIKSPNGYDDYNSSHVKNEFYDQSFDVLKDSLKVYFALSDVMILAGTLLYYFYKIRTNVQTESKIKEFQSSNKIFVKTSL